LSYKYKKISVNGRKVDEHCYVMEQKLGRKLERWEIVHHKDEDKLNNDPDNLEIKIKHTKFHYDKGDLHRLTKEDRAKANDPKGSEKCNAKLSEQQVAYIKRRISNGEGVRALAREYNVHHTLISQIKRGILYKHV